MQLVCLVWQTQASYHVSIRQGQPESCFMQQASCPFEAVAAAVAAASQAGVPVSRHHAQRAIARHAATFAGLLVARPGFACRARRHRCARLRHA